MPAAFIKRDHKIIPALTAPGPNQSAPGRLAQLAGDAFYFGKLVQKPTIGIRAVR